ncbi:MAG: carbamoyltransferase HypF, partial [Planctomycetales bacterium]|nr:carbamoyltransferase HypF [Planctomycetales bacterium]
TTGDLLTNTCVSPAVAPDNPFLGVMLPYTPLHHLLMRRLSNRPVVMTSGNATDEPIAYQNDDARSRLSGIADIFLTHNRPIRVRADDSIVRVNDGNQQIVRRSRGFAPEPILLPIACDTPTLAVGGQFKSVFAHGRDRHAILSHHLGDLGHYDAYQAFERDVRLYEQLFEVTPQRIVHDLHPDYGSTGYATRRASDECIERLGVQHHHAHMASCMAEHGLTESVIGVVWDGAGYGLDGAIWGGEMLLGDYTGFVRAAHFRYVRLPGGDRAVREPWRIAIAHLRDADCPNSDRLTISPSQSRLVERMIARGFNAPFTSSAGRLFDAVAALIGLRDEVTYEGQAAMQLEWLATQSDDCKTYPIVFTEDGSRPVGIGRLPPDSNSSPFGNSPGNAFARDWPTFPFVIDTRPLIRSVVEDMSRETLLSTIARRFHSSLVDALVAGCERIRQTTAIATVVLSGGVFLNTILSREAPQRLRAAGFRVYCQQLVPPGDGGLCLGQLAVAACQNKMALDRDD